MYALKTINCNLEKSVILGNSYSIKFEKQGGLVGSNTLAVVSGENESLGYDIPHGTEAFITTVEGKTVRVINRIEKTHLSIGA